MKPPKPRIWRNAKTKMWQGKCEPCRLGFGAMFWPIVLLDVLGHLDSRMHAQETALWSTEVDTDA